MKFDVTPLLSAAQIERAILRMWVNDLDREGLLNFQEVLASWEEKKFRAKDIPPLGPVFHSVPIGKSDEDNFLTVEVTSLVQGWLDHPATNFGLALVSDDADAVKVEFDSKENRRTSHPMEIEVTLTPGVGPEGPQGPEGDPGPAGPIGPPVQLLMLGKNCLAGEFLTGFDTVGNILCSQLPDSQPPEPSVVNDVNPGDVFITEIMADPSIVSDVRGEWFEIRNGRSDVVDISGWIIQDAINNDVHTVLSPNPVLIPPGEFLVLGRNADPTLNGGILVDYQYSSFFLGNDGDTIVLLDINGEEIDRVDYGEVGFPDPTGASLNLDTNHLNGNDNDNGSFWCNSTTPIGLGTDSGTPGMANELCSSE